MILKRIENRSNQRVAVVTGSSSGNGYETSLTLARNGFVTYATMRNLIKGEKLKSVAEKDNEPNGNLIVRSLAIDEAAKLEKKGYSMKTVDLTCTTGTPDQLRTCSPSQCCCCCGYSVISVRLI
jgi:NAD(P)-dependent dehydrogenase (short-subunit alcohol dehydrogenase family)